MAGARRNRGAERAAVGWLIAVLVTLVVGLGLCSGFVYWVFA